MWTQPSMLAYNKEISDSFHDIWCFTNLCTCVYELSVRLSVARSFEIQKWYQKYYELECGPMPNLMVALPNIGGALCSTPQSLADAHY